MSGLGFTALNISQQTTQQPGKGGSAGPDVRSGSPPEASQEALRAVSIAAMDSEHPEQEIFHPVVCSECSTEIGVFEPKEELFHFFDVLATDS